MEAGAYTNQPSNTNPQGFVFSSNFGVSDEVAGAIMAMAAAKKPGKMKTRKSLMDEPRSDLDAGRLPAKLNITSEANIAYAKRADKMHALAAIGNLDELEAIQITGSNSYSNLLRDYRSVLVAYVKKGA